MVTNNYHEINGMSLADVREALNLAYTNGADGAFLKDGPAREDFIQRVAALEARFVRLVNTEASIKRVNQALAGSSVAEIGNGLFSQVGKRGRRG